MTWIIYILAALFALGFYFVCGRHILQAVVFFYKGLRTDAAGRQELLKEMKKISDERAAKRDVLSQRKRVAAKKMSSNSN